MGYRRTHCPRSLKICSTSGHPNYPPTPKSRTLWKPSKMCIQRNKEISVEGNHHLYIQYSTPTELTAFLKKRHLNCDFTALNTLYHLQKGLDGTSIQVILLRRTGGGLRCHRKDYIRKWSPLEKGMGIFSNLREKELSITLQRD